MHWDLILNPPVSVLQRFNSAQLSSSPCAIGRIKKNYIHDYLHAYYRVSNRSYAPPQHLAHINILVKIPAPNIQVTVTRLENDIAPSPDNPCPEVQPPPSLAPNANTVPPIKACQAGIAP
jgi:hypothetical protein